MTPFLIGLLFLSIATLCGYATYRCNQSYVDRPLMILGVPLTIFTLVLAFCMMTGVCK